MFVLGRQAQSSAKSIGWLSRRAGSGVGRFLAATGTGLIAGLGADRQRCAPFVLFPLGTPGEEGDRQQVPQQITGRAQGQERYDPELPVSDRHP